ncbi:MAG TPA: DUF3089 domain-containing protein, partial [Polyangiales bacterium]
PPADASDPAVNDARADSDDGGADGGSSGSPEAGSVADASLMDAGSDTRASGDASANDANTGLDADANNPSPDAAEGSVQPLDAQPADASTDAPSTAPDAAPSIYDDNTKWLCRPGLPNNPCLQKLEITELHADGGTSISELPQTPADVGTDCLYLYPTVDPGLFAPPRNLDFPQIDRPAVEGIFFAQGVPFRGTCAVYAPLYRQTSLVSFEQPDTREKGLETAYRDLEAAFDYYLRHAAPGRPIVLVAHSQGAIVTSRLLKRRFEGHPELLSRLVVAVLAGPMGGVVVPDGAVVGGTLNQIPLCTANEQTGCVLTYNTFAASATPNADYTKVNGMVQAGFDPGCTTPPGGSAGSTRRLMGALFPAQLTGGLAGLLSPSFDFGSVRVRTRYARYADFYTARCTDSSAGLSYLEIAAAPQPGDRRQDPVPYDHFALNDRAIGLHALDYTFVSAELVQAVATKISAHRK